MEDSGYWTALSSSFSIDKENRLLTSNNLTLSLLSKARLQAKRPNIKKWVLCEEEIYWTLAHNNLSKTPARDIAPWSDPKLLSLAIDSGSYEQKAIRGFTQASINLALFYS